MKNIFSDLDKKKIPKKMTECYEGDIITNSLWKWCESLETAGKVLAVIVGIAALIIGCVLFEDSDGVSLFISFLGAPIAALLVYLFLHIDALLIGSLASIVQHTKISANTALYNCSNASENVNEHSNQTVNSKKKQYDKVSTAILCPSCGYAQLSNSDYCSSCGAELSNNKKTNNDTNSYRCEKCNNLISSYPCVHCGHKKLQNQDNKLPNDNHDKICPKCGKSQPKDRAYCYFCNHKFD